MADNINLALDAYKRGAFEEALHHARAAATSIDEAGKAEMLSANIHLKLGQKLAAAEAFTRAAEHIAEKRAEFLTFAARLYLTERRADRLADIAVEVGHANAGDAALILDMAQMLLGAGLHPVLDALVPLLDLSNNWHFQVIINHYQLTRKPGKLKPLIEARYRETPEDSFVATNYFLFCRSSLYLPATRQWQEIVSDPENRLVAEILYRDQPLSRCYWSDDPAVLNGPSGAIDNFRNKLGTAVPSGDTPRRGIRPAGERLRIGYLSSDYTVHATMYLLYDVFVAHDRSRYDITFFCQTPAGQAQVQKTWDAQLQAEIVPVRGMSHEEVAQEISRRGIDILVDLKGHTAGHLLGATVLSDAPVKATWIGYPGSVRGADLDYHITDPIVTPDSARPWFEEKLCRLPDTYQGNCSRTKPQLKPVSRADQGLPQDAFVFASFNSPAKISPQTVDLWVRVLKAVPESLLWILASGPLLQENFATECVRLGIDRERVIFAEGADYPDHVSRVGLADLALDTFPYNGHTTTSDLLWGGLPVLTKRGQTFASRVSESLLTAIGLPDLVAEDEDDFVAKAVDFAAHPHKIAALKQRLAENRRIAPLFDTDRFTRHLERAYDMMAERSRAGLAPDHIDVPALPPRQTPFLAESLPEQLLSMAATLDPASALTAIAAAYRHRDHAGILTLMSQLEAGGQMDDVPVAIAAMMAEAHDWAAKQGAAKQREVGPQQSSQAEKAAALYAAAAMAPGDGVPEPARLLLLERAMQLYDRKLAEGGAIHLTGYEVARRLFAAKPDHQRAYLYQRHAMRQMAAIEDLRTANALAFDKLCAGDGFFRRNELLVDTVVWCADEAVSATIDVSRLYQPFDAAMRDTRRARPHLYGDRIRLGYLLPDLHADQPLARALRSVCARHDPARFEVMLFSIARRPLTPQEMQWSEGLVREGLGRLIPLGHLPLGAAVKAIRAEGVDVLIDLSGPTSGGWPELVNSGPAPVQVAYMGFSGSGLGIDCDYVIGDHFVTPPASAVHYHEAFCRLPESYWLIDGSDRLKPPVLSRADLGLADGLLFGAFTDLRKLSPESIDLWSAVLARVPEAKLLLTRANPLQERNLLGSFARNGIGADRIVFGARLDEAGELARMAVCDLGLDSTPYNGHASSADMLFAGLPVLTLKGTHFASRTSESLLNAAGLPDLVAQTAQDYVELAVHLARAPDALAALRSRLAAGRAVAPLFDIGRSVRHLERGFEMMVARARAGLAPDHIDVPAL
ncbi:O-linked N-acetylglucosamine transferase, SPINDLY family protein [Allorhizobium taibaishanense]|uniref:Putative O-linked N-acetylglucosamine transferase (SPINDLY family) n=1 Tax=Allorhizobium taibaishanense TaxID=887144 RepID=A0A1Q9AAT3_9HYPH|nr:hypothetical protein [Allorhizobium taibaishanense]MBB4007146.1 putative O-linked N-acetylglucosamine transferase (SPINDLY family) [Allorhizobium taibaishanense]OLP51932.1 hypothetical protein BJF91_23765 [Allorhizobium taibaishanense]